MPPRESQKACLRPSVSRWNGYYPPWGPNRGALFFVGAVAHNRADDPSREAWRKTSHRRYARGHQCDPVHPTNGMPVAQPSTRLPSVGDGLLVLLAMVQRWDMDQHT